MTKLRATVGLLTYNNADTLERCLESIKDFSEIIIADGGSTDDTVSIARRYGARVVSQSRQNTPISDFAKERNILLSSATQKWFFYLDSDETVSSELMVDMRTVTENADSLYGAYRVRYLKTNAGGSKKYRTFKEYYQIRLFRTDIGAVFERPIHERIKLPSEVKVGQLEGVWYVPLEKEDLSFRFFTRKAWRRIGISAQSWEPANIFDIIRRLVGSPCVEVLKSLTKMVLVKVRWGSKGIPAQYEILRAWYALMYSLQHSRRLLQLLVRRKGS